MMFGGSGAIAAMRQALKNNRRPRPSMKSSFERTGKNLRIKPTTENQNTFIEKNRIALQEKLKQTKKERTKKQLLILLTTVIVLILIALFLIEVVGTFSENPAGRVQVPALKK